MLDTRVFPACRSTSTAEAYPPSEMLAKLIWAIIFPSEI